MMVPARATASCCPADPIVVDVPIRLTVRRSDTTNFEGEASTATVKRSLAELAEYLDS